MARFVQAHPTEPDEIKQKCRIRDRADWTGVFDKLEAAKNAYSQTDNSFKATFRKVYRKTADHSGGAPMAIVDAAKDLLDVDYASPVLGALRLVLDAASKAAKLRQDMMGAFDNIDRNFTEVEVYQQEFAGDENIREASIDLVASVLYAIESVIGFFISKTYRRLLRATFTIDEYRKRIDGSLNDIDKKASELLREVQMSKTHRDHMFQTQALQDTSMTQYGVAQLHSMFHGTRNAMMSMMNDLVMRMDGISAQVSRPPSPRPVTPVYLISAAPSPEPQPLGISPQELLHWVGITDMASQDLEYMESRNHDEISPAEQGRAEQLVVHQQLQSWLSVPASSQLLIHGNDEGGLSPVSALSLFCASLAFNLDSHPRIIRLLFFCGLHSDTGRSYRADDYYEEDDTGGRAIISSFICQLLCAHDFGSELPFGPEIEDTILYGEVNELCNVFSTLVRQLPRSVVLVCVIDGAAYYERREFLDNTAVVLAHILRLSADSSVLAVFKVLITSSTPTIHIRQPFPDEMILSMAAMGDAEWEPSQARLNRFLSNGQDNL
ncbi:hypothetical protein Sste5346_007921 [Sporothrix stenoceras]|uniref:Fungal STAND N-terminal Goodbye domain-containing protein n=1 Tax=Sporothrix stenoceras TaxID=5173 RepID=A0ABR3YSU4_9PEZI